MIDLNVKRRHRRLSALMILWLVVSISGSPVHAQQGSDAGLSDPGVPTSENFPVDAADIQSVLSDEPTPQAIASAAPSGIDLLTLMMRGGAFMVPIGLMSLMVVALVVERLISLRRGRILPRALEQDLTELCDPPELFDPSAAFQSCQEHPSATARVINSMLVRTGQPLNEIERAATETIQREIDKCAAPIRWLTLAAAATPLMGLLGTVWGMIVAFHESTTLTPDRSRSEQLSEGIYTALVTTLAGLAVAIPAAILALYLENRLLKLFHHVEEFVFELSPGLARFTGRRRLDSEGRMHPLDADSTSRDVPKPPPVARASEPHDGAKAV